MINDGYWIWLQKCLGEGAYFKKIIEDFGSVEALYNSNILERRISPALVQRQVDALEKFTLSDVEIIIDVCKQNNWKIITYDDSSYPQRLRDIPNPPAVLYVDGTLPDIDNTVAIGIVGTRKASSYALKAAYIMSKGISLCGAAAISGGALGVDSAAHKGALSVRAKTVAVLGNGLGADYLRGNQALRDEIRQNGALVTEYPPFTPASRRTFPMRNRIISGLSLGVLVVEAGVKSGSLITAKYANEQGRDIYAIPASIFDYDFYGTNKLIDDGASVATSPSILIERYAESYASVDMSRMKTVRELLEEISDKSANIKKEKQITFDNIIKDREKTAERQSAALELKDDEKAVYDTLGEAFIGIDLIIDKSSLESKKVLAALTMLEIKGLVQSTSGKRYKLK
ncbi:MAG: DNA-processing protein DprA [Eubacterium sp.]